MEIAKFLAIIFAGLGLLLNAFSIFRATRQRRIAQVSDVYNRFFDDKELLDIYYKIEYSEFRYHDNFHGSDDEKKLDKLLALFDSLAKHKELGFLSIKDLDLVAYEYLVTYEDPEIKKYLGFLDDWFSSREISRKPFHDFRIVGQQIKERNKNKFKR